MLKWVFAVEHRHGEGRWHLHAVLNAAAGQLDIDEIKSLWPFGHVDVSRLFNSEHRFDTWLDVARYMTKERPEDGEDTTPVGAQIYSCSRNLTPPRVVTEWIEDTAPLVIPAGAFVYDRNETENEYSRYKYIKYMTAPLFLRN